MFVFGDIQRTVQAPLAIVSYENVISLIEGQSHRFSCLRSVAVCSPLPGMAMAVSLEVNWNCGWGGV